MGPVKQLQLLGTHIHEWVRAQIGDAAGAGDKAASPFWERGAVFLTSHKGVFMSSLRRGLSWRRWAGSGGPHPWPDRPDTAQDRLLTSLAHFADPCCLCFLAFKPVFLLSRVPHFSF